ncbi:MAG: 1-acyl-sn-glycerol-3-phosphate acyltransferase [Nannocystaceae bacterium]|nr:1-acyl-sn-glycerol-3-phosphate acyltransferase [Nannocystaceae bacterium]
MSLVRHAGLVLFSLWAWGGGFAWMFVGASGTLLMLLVGLPYQRVHGWFTAPMFVHVVRYFAAARVRVHYHPQFDPECRSVFLQNHVNLLDGHLASAAIPHAFSGLMNAWQFHIPIYGWLMRLSKGIGVRKTGRERIIAELSAAARERKRIGMSVLTFPEGHRTLDGKVHAFRRGVFLMARNAEMPVVPIAAHGFYDVNHKGTLLMRPLRRVEVLVGPQFPTAGLSDAEVGELATRMQEMVAYAVEHGRWPEALPSAVATERIDRDDADRVASLTSGARSQPR